MTPDGQQMEPAQYIANYTSGTVHQPLSPGTLGDPGDLAHVIALVCSPCSLVLQESRPIFAFNRAVLQRPHAPQILPLDINGWSVTMATVM